MYEGLDFVTMQGHGGGSVAATLLRNGMDVRAMRTWCADDPDRDPRVFMSKHVGGKERVITVNNPISQGLLRKNDWITLDEVVLKAAKSRLRFIADIRSAGLTYNIPDGMAKPVLQYERQSDITPATLSMDGLRDSDKDRPLYDLNSLPLPIAHKDFTLPLRQLESSRTGYSPLDTATADLAGRRTAEIVEQLGIGTTTFQFGGVPIYGILNFPSRITGSLTQKPFTGGSLNASWNPGVTLADVLAMKTASQQHFHFGPWMLYCGLAWDAYMDNDYVNVQVGTSVARVGAQLTLRERLRKIDNLIDVRTLDFFPQGTTNDPAFDLNMVQFTPEVIRLVLGMDFVTVQWETHGGFELHFKVLCITVPQTRADMNNNTGIVHWN